MEIFVIFIVEVYTHLLISLSVQQTPSRPQTELPKKPEHIQRKSCQKSAKKQVTETSNHDITRVDCYAKHLKNTRSFCQTLSVI